MLFLRRDRVKKVFIFFLIYLPVQYLFIGISGVLGSEPWPAFALPGFKKVLTTQHQIQVLKPSFYLQLDNSTGDEIIVKASDLFDGIQPSQLQGFIRKNFSQPQEFEPEVRDWFRRQVTRLYPAVNAKSLKIRWENIIYEQSKERILQKSREDIRVVTILLDT